MKKPDEIKDGLECCKLHDGDMYTDCSHCPYYLTCTQCEFAMHEEALAYIQQLERERDALMECTKGHCESCAFLDDCFKHDPDGIHDCRWFGDCEDWEWRGVKEPCTGASDGCTGASNV